MELRHKSKVNIVWNVSPYDYSKEKEDSIVAKAASKYKLDKSCIRVIPNFPLSSGEESCLGGAEEAVRDIQDPSYQLKLFRRYIEEKGIEGVDFSMIESIDADINSRIDTIVYDKYRRYSLKWVRWSNFLSYGEDNYFDFTSLGKFVLVNGQPSNQSGKTTFAIDLIHFLLFGRIKKYKTQEKIFNKYLPEATNVTVEGCIVVDGEDYVIKRTLTRPALSRRSAKSITTQKVEYYRIVKGELEELEDYVDEQQEENSAKTNKVIKETIGTEDDFDLVVSVTESNLDSLIMKKDAERGRLLSRWIGLLPIEDKEAEARAKFNTDIKPRLLSNAMNVETVTQEITALNTTVETLTEAVNKASEELKKVEVDIASSEAKKTRLIESKGKIDSTLISVDSTTLKRQIETVVEEGKRKRSLAKSTESEIASIGDVEFSNEEFDELSRRLMESRERLAELRSELKNKVSQKEKLEKDEICPFCHRKLDNVDHSSHISKLSDEIASVTTDGKKEKAVCESLEKSVASLRESRDRYNRKNKLIMELTSLNLGLSETADKYRELSKRLSDYQANQEAIDRNNRIDIEIRNTEQLIAGLRKNKDVSTAYVASETERIKQCITEISRKTEIVSRLHEEEKLVKHWKVYLDILGKDGITKMVLREVIPIINGRLSAMLSDICDFTVEMVMTPKNEVVFYLCKDGVYSELSGASGFELTASGLALRSVLGGLSVIPKLNFFVADEIMGRVAKENYDNMKLLMERVSKDYDFVLNITHLDDFKDFCDTQVSIVKENNISRIEVRKQG